MSEPTKIEFNLVAVLIERDGKYLFVEESKPGRENQFTIPGGHIESHETVIEAAIRETKEESGFDIEPTGVVGFYQNIYSHGNYGGLVIYAKIISGQATPSPEHPSLIWLTKSEINTYDQSKRLFTKFPPAAVESYESNGYFPLEIIQSFKHY